MYIIPYNYLPCNWHIANLRLQWEGPARAPAARTCALGAVSDGRGPPQEVSVTAPHRAGGGCQGRSEGRSERSERKGEADNLKTAGHTLSIFEPIFNPDFHIFHDWWQRLSFEPVQESLHNHQKSAGPTAKHHQVKYFKFPAQSLKPPGPRMFHWIPWNSEGARKTCTQEVLVQGGECRDGSQQDWKGRLQGRCVEGPGGGVNDCGFWFCKNWSPMTLLELSCVIQGRQIMTNP